MSEPGRTKSKLTLSKRTLKSLSQTELGQVNGGLAYTGMCNGPSTRLCKTI